MANDQYAGHKAKIAYDAGGGYVDFTKVTGIDFPLERGEIDASTFDDQDWERKLNDRKTTSIDVDALLEDTLSASQAGLFSAWMNDTPINVRLRPRGAGSGYPQWIIPMWVGNMSIKMEGGAPVGLAIKLRLNGPAVMSTQ